MDPKDGKKKTIFYKIKEILPQSDNSYLVFITLRDEKGTWTKSYKYSSSNVIKLDRVKETVEADVRKDLKVDKPLAELEKAIGQEFNFEL